MSLNKLNTFSPESRKGHLVQTTATVFREARLADSVVGTVEPSTAVKLSGYEDGQIVVPTSAIDDAVYGFMVYGTRDAEYIADERVRLVLANAIMDFEATGTLAVGAEVEFNPATGQVQALSTGTKIGTVLKGSTATGQIVKVELFK